MHKYLVITILLASLFSVRASATDHILVPDMSLLKYQIHQGKVHLRNLNEFDNTWLGCCYSYYIDLSTEHGKATWSTMLTKITMKQPYYIGVVSKATNPSEVVTSGVW